MQLAKHNHSVREEVPKFVLTLLLSALGDEDDDRPEKQQDENGGRKRKPRLTKTRALAAGALLYTTARAVRGGSGASPKELEALDEDEYWEEDGMRRRARVRVDH
jgi:hypothetical protein